MSNSIILLCAVNFFRKSFQIGQYAAQRTVLNYLRAQPGLSFNRPGLLIVQFLPVLRDSPYNMPAITGLLVNVTE